ncbi:MAG: hypothetical protein Q4C25_08420, partial [Bacillota bacterium]|nr:hypothetical protein [Bacillota bacterium]
ELTDALNDYAAQQEGLRQWTIKENTNGGYPVFGAPAQQYAISTDVKGKGTLEVFDGKGTGISKASAGATVKVIATPGKNRTVENVKLYDADGKTLQKFDLEPAEDGSVAVSFEMPGQAVTVHAKFVKVEDSEDGGADGDVPGDGSDSDGSEGSDDSGGSDGEGETAPADNTTPTEDSVPADAATFGYARLTDQATGIIVTGKKINTKAILQVTDYDENDPDRVQLEDEASDDVLSAYDVALILVDEDGNQLDTGEKTFKGTIDVAFPIDESLQEKNLQILHGTDDGLKLENGQLEDDGLYHVDVSHLSPFLVVDYMEDQEANLSAGESLDESTPVWVWVLIAAALVIIIAGALLYRRRRMKTPEPPKPEDEPENQAKEPSGDETSQEQATDEKD